MQDLDTRLAELGRMDDGWLEGEGVAPSKAALSSFRVVAMLSRGGFPIPTACPTEDGSVCGEWESYGWPFEVEVSPDLQVELWVDPQPESKEDSSVEITCSVAAFPVVALAMVSWLAGVTKFSVGE